MKKFGPYLVLVVPLLLAGCDTTTQLRDAEYFDCVKYPGLSCRDLSGRGLHNAQVSAGNITVASQSIHQLPVIPTSSGGAQ